MSPASTLVLGDFHEELARRGFFIFKPEKYKSVDKYYEYHISMLQSISSDPFALHQAYMYCSSCLRDLTPVE